MATHFSTLAWEIPWTEEPGGLQSKGLQRIRLYLMTEHACITFLTLIYQAKGGKYFHSLPSLYLFSYILESLLNILVFVLLFEKETIIFPFEFPFSLPN